MRIIRDVLKALDFFRLLREAGWRTLMAELRENIDFKVCVREYVCVYVCVNVCVNVCEYVCEYVCVNVCAWMFMHVNVRVRVRVCMHASWASVWNQYHMANFLSLFFSSRFIYINLFYAV